MLRKLVTLLSFSTLALTGAAQASEGGNGSGGGDLQCDARIKEVTSNLREWFQGLGPEKNSVLDLSSTLNPLTSLPYTKQEYRKAMEAIIAMPLRSACVHRSPSRVGAPVTVGSTPKICRTRVSGGVVEMLCDGDLFLNMSGGDLQNQDLQIQQIHHEFAINVPGLEPDSASSPKLKPSTIDISSYRISRQLAKVTQTTTVRKVVVMDPATSVVTSGDSKIMQSANAAACNMMMAKGRKAKGEEGNIQTACYQVGILAQSLTPAQINSLTGTSLLCQSAGGSIDQAISELQALGDSVSSPEALRNKAWYFSHCEVR